MSCGALPIAGPWVDPQVNPWEVQSSLRLLVAKTAGQGAPSRTQYEPKPAGHRPDDQSGSPPSQGYKARPRQVAGRLTLRPAFGSWERPGPEPRALSRCGSADPHRATSPPRPLNDLAWRPEDVPSSVELRWRPR